MDKKIIFLYKLVDEAEYVDGSDGEHESAMIYITKVLDSFLGYDINKFADIMKKISQTVFSYGLIDRNDIISNLGDDDTIPTNIEIDKYIDILIELNEEFENAKLYIKIAKLIEEYRTLDECVIYCEKVLKENWNNKFYFQHFINYYLERLETNNYDDKLLEILDILISHYHEYGWSYDIIKYFELSLKLLKKHKREDEYKNKLLEYYKVYPNVDKFIELKKILKLENNSDIYQELLLDARRYGNDAYAGICINENLLSDAFEVAKNDIGILTKYGEYLEEKYRNEMIRIYIEHYKGMADRASCRKDYQRVITNLIAIKNLKLRDEVYTEMVNYIKNSFKNRPDFQDELEYFMNRI